MKAALNGVLNLSVLDGWWIEACIEGRTGWAIGDGESTGHADDAKALYDKLERTVLPPDLASLLRNAAVSRYIFLRNRKNESINVMHEPSGIDCVCFSFSSFPIVRSMKAAKRHSPAQTTLSCRLDPRLPKISSGTKHTGNNEISLFRALAWIIIAHMLALKVVCQVSSFEASPSSLFPTSQCRCLATYRLKQWERFATTHRICL
jgi:hypothetical protein